MALATAAERGLRIVTFDSNNVMYQGVLQVPIIGRPDLDYGNATRKQITNKNTQLDEAEKRFWGNPDGYSYGSLEVTRVFTSKKGDRGRTFKQPAGYYPEAVLVVATTRQKPSPEEMEHAKETGERIATVQYRDLSREGKEIYVANFLGAFRAGIDTAETEADDVIPVGIVHHTPVTDEVRYINLSGEEEGLSFPRSAGDLHGTVGVIRSSDIKLGLTTTPLLTAERRLQTAAVIVNLRTRMARGLNERGFGPDVVRVTARRKKPAGIGIHLLDLNKSELTTQAGIQHAADIFTAISDVYTETYPFLFDGVPDSIQYGNLLLQKSPVEAHRQISHIHDGNFVYGLSPIPFGTKHGGGEVSGFFSDRSVNHKSTDEQLAAIGLYNYRANRRISEGINNLRKAA